jgi:uncharacterized membrane protein YphA (DoxX/SURF4 family)
VLLIVGIVFVVVGISDFLIAGLVARKQSSSTGGLGAEPPPVSRILRRSGAVTVLIGVVLVVIGLAE